MSTENEVRVSGYCPSCGNRGLILYLDVGEIVCRLSGCTDPYLLHKIIQDDEVDHILWTHIDSTYTLLHPLKERFNNRLAYCPVGEFLAMRGAGSLKSGKYRVKPDPTVRDSFSFIQITDR